MRLRRGANERVPSPQPAGLGFAGGELAQLRVHPDQEWHEPAW